MFNRTDLVYITMALNSEDKKSPMYVSDYGYGKRESDGGFLGTLASMFGIRYNK